MNIILRKIGKLNKYDLSFIRSKDALEYVQPNNIGSSEHPFSFLDKLKHISPEMRGILKSMLEFNPYFRVSAKEALGNKYFDDIRIPMNEGTAPYKLKFDIDTDDAFDYDTGKSLKYNAIAYRTMIVNIINEEHTNRLKQFEAV